MWTQKMLNLLPKCVAFRLLDCFKLEQYEGTADKLDLQKRKGGKFLS